MSDSRAPGNMKTATTVAFLLISSAVLLVLGVYLILLPGCGIFLLDTTFQSIGLISVVLGCVLLSFGTTMVIIAADMPKKKHRQETEYKWESLINGEPLSESTYYGTVCYPALRCDSTGCGKIHTRKVARKHPLQTDSYPHSTLRVVPFRNPTPAYSESKPKMVSEIPKAESRHLGVGLQSAQMDVLQGPPALKEVPLNQCDQNNR